MQNRRLRQTNELRDDSLGQAKKEKKRKIKGHVRQGLETSQDLGFGTSTHARTDYVSL